MRSKQTSIIFYIDNIKWVECRYLILHTYLQCKVIDVPIVVHLILRCHLNDIVSSTIYHTRCSGCIRYNWNQNYSHISHGAHCWGAEAIMWRNNRNWSLHIIQINSQQYKHASTILRNINTGVRSSKVGMLGIDGQFLPGAFLFQHRPWALLGLTGP